MRHLWEHFQSSLCHIVHQIRALDRADIPNKTATCLLCNCSAIVRAQGPLFHLLIEPDNALVSSTRLIVLKTTKKWRSHADCC
jgi:hypothetical protein